MENTNEKQEMVTPDTVVNDIVEHDEELVEERQENNQVTNDEPTEENSTMSVLKQFPQVCTRIAEIMREHAENVAMDLLQKGMNYDEAVALADKEGYRRGKNEKIELVKNHRMPQLDKESEDNSTENAQNIFPKYGKRSIWD